MIELKFDSYALFQDMIHDILIPSANEAMQNVYADIQYELDLHPKMKKRKSSKDDIELQNAVINQAGTKISAACASYGWALIESYGSGTKVDLQNEELISYIQSNLWNPVRHGFQIVGRPEGNYTNFFGEETSSKGNREGKTIGGWGKGISPNYAIQNAEKRLERGINGGFVDRILQLNTERFFEEKDLSQYFTEVNT